MLFAWGTLAIHLSYLQRLYSKGVRWCSTTMRVTPLISGESLLYDTFWNFASKKSSAVFQKQVCISLPQLAEARHPRSNYRTNKTMEGLQGILSSFILTFAHLHFFYHGIELIYKTFLKASQQNCKVFQLKMSSGLYLFIFERRNAEIFPNRILL